MMPVDVMFVLATAAFAWGLSLVTYRWLALHNGWPMGAWQVTQPALPRAIGVATIVVAMLFALTRGYATALVLPMLAVLGAISWTGALKVGAQSALLLAPLAVVLMLIGWSLGGA